MSAYRKLVAAILSTLIMRWIARYFGFDPAAMGLDGDVLALVDLGIDAAFAAVNGFWVWLLPNASPKRERMIP